MNAHSGGTNEFALENLFNSRCQLHQVTMKLRLILSLIFSLFDGNKSFKNVIWFDCCNSNGKNISFISRNFLIPLHSNLIASVDVLLKMHSFDMRINLVSIKGEISSSILESLSFEFQNCSQTGIILNFGCDNAKHLIDKVSSSVQTIGK